MTENQAMADAKHTPGPLSEPCMAILEANEASATPMTGVGGTVVTLHDCDGDWLFRVHKDIHPEDLRSMFSLHRLRFAAGVRAGREEAFAGLRALIGVDVAIAKATGSTE